MERVFISVLSLYSQQPKLNPNETKLQLLDPRVLIKIIMEHLCSELHAVIKNGVLDHI